MKFLLGLVVLTLTLGSALSLHFESIFIYYFPLYLLTAYHIYRLNLSEGFFLVFREKETHEENAKVRLGPAEIGLKDDADKNEDKFLALFDWKKTTIRKILSWGVFCLTIWFLFFKLHLEITLESVMPAVTALFLMRVIAVGHFLFPLAMNLFLVLLALPEYHTWEWAGLVLYGLLFVLNLSLIYPSEERIGKKISEWKTGHWQEVIRAALIILLSLTVGLSIFTQKFESHQEENITQEKIQLSQEKLMKLESSLRNLLKQGLLKENILSHELEMLKRDLRDFVTKENKSPEEWKALEDRQLKLEEKFESSLSRAETPELSPELLDYLKKDLSSRSGKGIDPETFSRMKELLQDMEKADGVGGRELVARYREIKYGEKGFYREETELSSLQAHDENAQQQLEMMAKSLETKQEILSALDKNIAAMRNAPEPGLQSVNDALKNELENSDSLTPADREAVTKELANLSSIQDQLSRKMKDQELRDKLEGLKRDQQQLKNELIPHMNASAKAAFAEKLLQQKKATEELEKIFRDEKAGELQSQEEARKKTLSRKNEDEADNKTLEKFSKLLVLFGGGILVFWFIRLLSKKGVKRVRGTPEVVKEEIQEKLIRVKRKKLSPREEVIETYNVLHDSLQILLFHTETPPSCIVYEGISGAIPELKDSTFTVTETFARTFYGENPVTHKELKAFRRDVTKVFGFFDIRI